MGFSIKLVQSQLVMGIHLFLTQSVILSDTFGKEFVYHARDIHLSFIFSDHSLAAMYTFFMIQFDLAFFRAVFTKHFFYF